MTTVLMDPHYIGKQLRVYRLEQDRSVADVANEAAISHQTLRLLEEGETWPGTKTVADVAGALGYDASISFERRLP